MAEFEDDFVMRQVKDIRKALKYFLDDDSIDDILELDEQQAQELKNKKDTEQEKSDTSKKDNDKREWKTSIYLTKHTLKSIIRDNESNSVLQVCSFLDTFLVMKCLKTV